MTRVGDLDFDHLARQLEHPGLTIACGNFVARVMSSLPGVVAGVREHYADHPLASPDDIVDTRIDVYSRTRRRPWKPLKVSASVDEHEPFIPMDVSQAVPMLETALNFAVANRSHQYLIVHAAVVERDGRALVLVGASGAGKSTLSAALAFRGWRLLSDEMTLLRTDTGRIDPIPRPISLKNDSIDLMRGFDPAVRIGSLYHGGLKGTLAYARPPADSLARALEPAAPAWIVFPKYGRDAAPTMVTVPRSMAFMRLIGQSPNYVRLGGTGFTVLADLVDRVASFDMTYSRLEDAIDMVNALGAR